MNCLAQRKRFKNKHPAWTDPSEEKCNEPIQLIDEPESDHESAASSSDDDDNYEMVAGEVRSKRDRLEAKELRYKHLTNINNDRSFQGAVAQVQFHPTSRIALVSLTRGQTDLYEVDGERNRYIQNIKLPYTNKPNCAFKPDGNSIVISSDNYKGKFFTYDLVSGAIQKYDIKIGRESRSMTDFRIHGDYMASRKEGSPNVLILSSKTYENTCEFKLNEPAKTIRFADNDIFIAGENSNVYVWDLRKTKLCKHKFQDEGSVHTTSFALSKASNQLSLGSDSGIINSYDLDSCLTTKFPTPKRTYDNLNLPIDILEYNHSGELLFFGSSKANETFRMSHTLSGIIYRNFPIQRKQYGRLDCVDFSPLSGYLALGCSKGRAHLIRIPYYKSY